MSFKFNRFTAQLFLNTAVQRYKVSIISDALAPMLNLIFESPSKKCGMHCCINFFIITFISSLPSNSFLRGLLFYNIPSLSFQAINGFQAEMGGCNSAHIFFQIRYESEVQSLRKSIS